MYVTAAQLADLPGSMELAQIASAEHRQIVDANLMEATLRNQDRSVWTADEIAVADDALARIQNEIDITDQFVDGFLARRYPLPLPQTPGILTTWARAIVRYRLHKDQISDASANPIARDYTEAVKMLGLVANGQYSIGIDDPQSANNPEGVVQIESGEKVFSREQRGTFFQ
jgi:phage gp36-like protein